MIRKGFTLIELLIVMAVIAVLIGIAIPSFRGMQEEAKKAKAGGDLRVLKLAVEAYNAKNSFYPAVLASVEGESVVQTLPTDPFSTAAAPNNGYQYALSANSTYYIIYSVGKNNVSTGSISDAGVVTVGDADQIGTTNGTAPNTNWK